MKTILVPVDFSPATRNVVVAAIELSHAIGARLVLLHAVQPPVVTTDYGLTADFLQETIVISERTALRQLTHLETQVSAKGVPVSVRLVSGGPASNIVEQAGKLKAHYIVLGSHGHTAFYDLLVGSTTHDVLKKARCAVVVVPSLRKKTTRK